MRLTSSRKLETWPSSTQQGTSRSFDATTYKLVRKRDLDMGDLVLRRRQSNQGRPKLTPVPWEGPYVVVEVLKLETYKLADEKGTVFTNSWNIEQLRRFYPYSFEAYISCASCNIEAL